MTLSNDTTGPVAHVEWCIDSFLHFDETLTVRGWAFAAHPLERVTIELNGTAPAQHFVQLPSPDVERLLGPGAANCRFTIRARDVARDDVLDVSLVFGLRGGQTVSVAPDALRRDHLERDPCRRLFRSFFAMTRERNATSMLEIGSRARSGNTYTALIDEQVTYTGLDIVAGPNVDVVGDAHELTSVLRKKSFDAVFSISTFEHLAMPWKVALEINRVLRRGGIAFIQTHQTWALHEQPWDYWRFSSYAWDSLFNAATGFRVVQTAMGEPASIVPHFSSEESLGLPDQPAFLSSAVIVEKVGRTRLRWPVTTASIAPDLYPH